ncbi:MAG: ParB/RepB/Spo0J family partition protein [Planctomycetota bacterium]|nr:ParB/RepB/Spo0J family partition protein [Planctomycetota bacterium]
MTVAQASSRGLNALLGGACTSTSPEALPEGAIVQEVPIRDIAPNPDQPRKMFNEHDLQELAVSIKKHGVLQPVVIRPLPKREGPDQPRFVLVAGERRWRATALAGKETIPAIVRSVDDRETLELSLIENLQRADLNPMEQAVALRLIIDRFGLTQEELADRLGKPRPTVANILRLLMLPKPVQQMVREGRITAGHAKVLLSVGDPKLQLSLALRCESQGLSVRGLEKLLGVSDPLRKASITPKSPAHIAELERVLREHLGAPVRIREWHSKGRIIIEFYSNREFERILEKMGIGPDKVGGA